MNTIEKIKSNTADHFCSRLAESGEISEYVAHIVKEDRRERGNLFATTLLGVWAESNRDPVVFSEKVVSICKDALGV